MNELYFLVEGGKIKSVFDRWFSEYMAAREAAFSLLKEIGATGGTENFNGRLSGVKFPEGKVHPQFKRPIRGISYPKANSEFAKRISDLPGYDYGCNRVAAELGIPGGYTAEKAGDKGTMGGGFGNPFIVCGFLFINHPVGPVAFWCADIPGKIAELERSGYVITSAAKTWTPEFDGARPILKEEWDLIVAQHRLTKRKSESDA